jgi:30S ribosomal protein S31
MGKGDKKTRRGKIWRGSHGKKHPKGTRRSKQEKTVAKK